MQWSAANLRVMFWLLSEGKILKENMNGYLPLKCLSWQWFTNGHQVSRMIGRTGRPRLGRILSSIMKPTMHIDCIYLRHMYNPKIRQSKVGGKGPQRRKQTNVCGNYQQGNCVVGSQCIYRHLFIIPDCHATAYPAVSVQPENVYQQK